MSCNCKCLLVDRECVVHNTPLTFHVDREEIKKATYEAQFLHMKDVFGDCYDSLCTEVKKEAE